MLHLQILSGGVIRPGVGIAAGGGQALVAESLAGRPATYVAGGMPRLFLAHARAGSVGDGRRWGRPVSLGRPAFDKGI